MTHFPEKTYLLHLHLLLPDMSLATELCDAHVYPTYLISLLYMKKDAHGTTIHA